MSLASILDIARRIALVEQTVKLHGFGPETARAASHLLEEVTRLPPREVRAEVLTDVGRLLEDPAQVRAGVEGLTGLAHGHLARHRYSLLPNADPTTGLRRLIAGKGHRSYPIQPHIPLEGGEVIEPPPPRERLPIIDAYLRSRLEAVGPVVARLDKVLTWSRSQEGLSGRTRSLLGHVEEVRTQHERLKLDVERLDPSNASRLSRTALTLHPNLVMLEHELGRDPLVRSFLQSDIVNGQWGREVMARPDDPATLAQLGEISEGPARALLVQYFQYLRAAKGGDLGSFSEQPFDPKVLAVAIVRQGGEFDRATVQELLDFVHQRWRLPVPPLESIETAVGRVRGEMAELWNHHAALSGNAEVVPPERGDSFSDYLERFPLFEWDDLSTAFVGVGVKHALSWGSADSRPRDIGAVIHLHRCIAEEGARRMAMYGHGRGWPQIPDLLEMVRLAYGERARGLFESRDPADPHTLIIQVPEAIAGRSYGELFHANVLRLLREDRDSSTRDLMDTVRRTGEQPIRADTLRRHERGIMAPHRRMPRSRTAETALLELLGGSRALDAFLEFQPAFNQVAEIVLPNGQVRTPPGGARSSTRVRLVSSKPPPIVFAADRPVLEPSVFPFRWLLGERSPFHLLMDEVGAHLLAARGLSAEQPEVLDAIERDFLPMQATHPRLAANLPTYLHNPAVTPFDAVERYERFYRNLLSLSGRVFRIELKEEPTLIGAVASVIRGEGGGPEDFARLLRLRVGFDAFERRGSVRGDDLPTVVASMFPGLEPAARDLLARRYKNLRVVEEAPAVTSGLGPENPEVAAIMEAALRRNQKARGGLPSPKWLSEQLSDFLRIRYGIPPSEIGPYLQAVSRYFELNPRWHEAFRPDLLDQAFLESGAEGMRDDLTAFLYLMGAKLDESLEPDLKKIAGRPAAPTAVVAKAPPVEPAALPLPAGLIIPTASGRLVDSPELRLLIGHLSRLQPSDLRSAAGEFLDQRGAALGSPFTSEAREALIAQATVLFPRLLAQVSETLRLLPQPADPLARIVAEALIDRMIFGEEPISLPALTAEALQERRIRIGSSGYNRALEQVTGWFGAIEPSVTRDLNDLVEVFESAVEMHPKNREELFAAVIQSGKGVIAPFEGVHSEADLDPLVGRYERLGVLFAPEKAASLREVWETLLEFYPPVKKAEPEAAAPRPSPPRAAVTRPSGPAQIQRPMTLSPRNWDPAGFTLMTPDQQAAFAQEMVVATPPGEAVHIIIYMGGGRLRVARIDKPTYDLLAPIIQGRVEPEQVPPFLKFRDLVSGEDLSIPTIHSRETMGVTSPTNGSAFAWLPPIGPNHPSYGDLMTAQAIALQLVLPEPELTSRNRLFDTLAGNERLQTAREVRARLNGFMARHSASVRRLADRYRLLGPWGLSPTSARGLGRLLIDGSKTHRRLQLVLDLIDGDLLPTEVVVPYREAVIELESLEQRSEADYEKFVRTVSEYWQAALIRFTAAAKTELARAPEVMIHQDSVKRKFARDQIEPSLRFAKRKGVTSQIIFWQRVAQVMEEASLKEVASLLVLLTGADRPIGQIQFDELIRRVNAPLNFPRTAESRSELREGVISFYLQERPNILRRLWDQRTQPGYEWVEDVVEPQTGRRHALSAEFPELEEVPFRVIDNLAIEQGALLSAHDSVVLEIRTADGLSRIAFVAPRYLLPSAKGFLIGIRGAGATSSIYFSRLRGVERPDEIAEPDWTEGSTRSVALLDKSGRILRFQGREVAQIILPTSFSARERKEYRFMKTIFGIKELGDLFPLVAMLYSPSKALGESEAVNQKIGELLALGLEIGIQEVRRRMIEIYREARADFQRRGYHERFTRHIS